ncbi:DUF3558 domain-containing protein [Streptomyces sporangiiformans]|uniref:DUF3558 domain-containing protein n=1 Tax=Streptomyces sporangiiformans TaxID=2315329 RepID=A0A505D9J0_9ACTN|nr:DUF3558 domain-containing protein [Streptomyces sporangiiformans]TPQ20384.1 DUF3558 domain-containing protein [Streptomyces sporangiiformans]
MQRKAYVSGVAALLAALLAGCTGSGSDDETDDPKPGDASTTASTAQPGRYRTLPEPCGTVEQGTLNSLLPGLKQMTDKEQREEAYAGTATPTFDTDRKVGCRWKVESPSATDHLWVDFERVVSYNGSVSDDSRAEQIFAVKQVAANLPAPSASSSESSSDDSDNSDNSGESSDSEESGSDGAGGAANSSPAPDKSGTSDGQGGGSGDSSASPTDEESVTSSPTSAPSGLQPRTLDDLGDEAFLDDALGSSQQRTVTVVFRTSNVIVTIQYVEQPASTTEVPSSEEMQDRAQKLADQLAGAFDE